MRVLRLSVVAFAAALVVAGSASAQAPPPSPSSLAAAPSPAPVSAAAPPLSLADALVGAPKEEYLAGRELYVNGEYALALARFKTAYDASREPRLLWNAAVCEKAMGHYANAIALVRRYIDSGPPGAIPDMARNAQAFIAAAESRTAALDVMSNEAGATVYVDGKILGLTPLPEPAPVDQGVHEVTVRKTGFVDFSTQITATASADIHVVAPLALLVHDGRIAIHGHKGDAIAIDGRVVGGDAWEGRLPTGAHAVRVTAPGSRPFQVDLLVRDGETRTLDVPLAPKDGTAGIPTWMWIVGGTVLAAGATTAGYFLLKPADEGAIQVQGSIATVRSP